MPLERAHVVGGGLAGLAAANELADRGRPVVLFEQAATLGGRARTGGECGFALNFGPHAIYREGTVKRTLDRWGVPFVAAPPVFSSGAYLVRGEEKFAFVRDAAGLALTKMLSIRERIEAGLLLGTITSGKAESGESAETWLTSRAKSEHVLQFARTILRLSTYASDLTKLDAEATLRQAALSRGGVLYVDGGWQSMVDGLAARAESLGVEIRRGDKVDSLADFGASPVVLAVPPAEVKRLTGRSLPTLVPARMACLNVGLSRLPEGAAVFALGLDRPLYYSVQSTWAKLAPEGRAVVHLAKYLPGDHATDAATAQSDRREIEAFADLLMPGWRDVVETVQFLPSMIVTHGLPGPGGRPPVDALHIPNLRVGGDWVGDEGMLADASVASGIRAARGL